jgi:hypothetical protein
VTNLASPDPELRDDLAYSILTSWIYEQRLLGPDQLRPLIATLSANLRYDIGSTGTDAVLERSFSALVLSVIVARQNQTPFLTAAEFQQLLDAALAYFRDERDLRGFDEAKGWMHATAHTADLLKFLARSPLLGRDDQGRILTALVEKNRAAPTPFDHGEDERMARVVMSLLFRDDFDGDAFAAWAQTMNAAAAFPQPVTARALAAQQNARHLLAALWAELAADTRVSPGAITARNTIGTLIGSLY